MRYLYLRIKIFKDIENMILIEIYENFGGGLLVKIFTRGNSRLSKAGQTATVDCGQSTATLDSRLLL